MWPCGHSSAGRGNGFPHGLIWVSDARPGAMAAGSSPRRRFAQAASASRLAALMRITVEMIAFSNLK